MKKFNISKVMIFIAACFLVGCEDGLDTGLDLQPTGAVSEDAYWQSERDARLAVNAIYNLLDGTQMVIALDGVTDLGFHSASNVPTFNDVRLGELDPSNATITGIWNRYYRAIRIANDVIANIGRVEEGDPEVLARLEAEARFLRAYFYTQLSSLWCNVPLITEPIEVTAEPATNSKEEIVNFVISELNDIINSNALPIVYDGPTNVGRATHGAALTLKARIALRNNMWETVVDATQRVMDLGIYGLYPDYEGLFEAEGQYSQEIIFAREYALGGDTYNAFGYSAASLGGNSTVEPLMGLFEKYEYIGPVDPEDPFANKDPRWDYNTYYTGNPIGNDGIYNSWPTSNTPDRLSGSEWATIYGYNLEKWVDYETFAENPNLGSVNMILMRYADVLLMYAEAKIELGQIDESVYAAINAVRQRPTVEVPPIAPGLAQEEFRQIIRDERARELAFEGLRLFDINRWKIAEEKAGLLQGTYYIDAETGEWEIIDYGQVAVFNENRDYCWPIPASEIEINSAITQNPGY